MNHSIFQVNSTASQAQIASLFDNQLKAALCTVYLIEQYQRIVGQDEQINIDTGNIENLITSLLSQSELLKHIYSRYDHFLQGVDTPQQPSQPKRGQVFNIHPDSRFLTLRDFITMQFVLINSALRCFFEIEEALEGADGESYEQALHNTVTSIKSLFEQIQQAFKHLKSIAQPTPSV